jgi:hypothetical protein
MSLSAAQAQFLKTAFRASISLGGSILLGVIYKVGKQSDEKIVAYFDEHYPETKKVDKKKI